MASFGQRLREFRNAHGYTQRNLAERLGVGTTAVLRWENGTSKPTTEIADSLRSLGFGEIAQEETKVISTPRARLSAADSRSFKKLEGTQITLGDRRYGILPSPYVNNGPIDQLAFFEQLYNLQSSNAVNGNLNDFARRLSALS